MRVSALNAYVQSPAIGGTAPLRAPQTARINQSRINEQSPIAAGPQATIAGRVTPQSVLSPGERTFFAQLFPDFADRFNNGVANAINNSAAFDRRGRAESAQAAPGGIFDRRV